MENDILDSLEDLGYDGPLLDEKEFTSALEHGPSSVEFTRLVSWLTSQLKSFCDLEECANPIDSPDEATNFLMELGSCLRELNCPLRHLYEGGQVSDRLPNKQTRLDLLDYLTTELASTRMIAVKNPGLLKTTPVDGSKPKETESELALHLKWMLMTLGFPKPPTNITSFQLFSKVEAKIKELVSENPNRIGKPLMKARLSDKQWAQVMKINDALIKEYTTRREMLLKRLDVTIQSFMWSDKAKQRENDISAVYQPIRKALMSKPQIGVPQILCARDDLTRLQKTSSGEAREKTKCKINKVLIPKVPDRGGRAWELEPPPPEMPAFQKREAGRPQSGRGGYQQGGGGGGGYQGRGGYQEKGGRGGKVQGGWGDSQTQNQGGNWSQGGAGYGKQGGYQGSYNQGGGNYSQGGYNQGGGNYSQGGYGQGGGNYSQGGYGQGGGNYSQGGYGQGGGNYNQGGYGQGGGNYNQGYSDNYHRGGGGGGRRGRGGRGRGGNR